MLFVQQSSGEHARLPVKKVLEISVPLSLCQICRKEYTVPKCLRKIRCQGRGLATCLHMLKLKEMKLLTLHIHGYLFSFMDCSSSYMYFEGSTCPICLLWTSNYYYHCYYYYCYYYYYYHHHHYDNMVIIVIMSFIFMTLIV